MIPGALQRSPGICLMADEAPGKSQNKRSSDEGCATSYRLKWGPLHPDEVGRIAQHVGEGEGKKDGKDGWESHFLF